MNIKGLFFNDENDVKEDKKNVVTDMQTKFPSSPQMTTFPTTFPTTQQTTPSYVSGNNEFINKFNEVYQSCFDNANQNGYDFYEFFQAIVGSGSIDNPQMYVMAMNMGSAMDKSNTKSKLILL